MSEHSVVRFEAGAAPSVPRPAVVLVATAAAGAATFLGMPMVVDADRSAVHVVAALAIAALTLAVVPLAAGARVYAAAAQVALLSAGAAAIHFVVISEHFEEWWIFGLFFAVTAMAQLTWAVLIVTRCSRLLTWSGVVGNAAIVALWIVTRTAGMPLGPDAGTPEPVGVADSVASAFEVGIVAIGTWLAASVSTTRRTPVRIAWIVVAMTLVLTTVALLSAAAPGIIPAAE